MKPTSSSNSTTRPKSQIASNSNKSNYNTRSNPRLSFLNNSLSSIPKPSASKLSANNSQNSNSKSSTSKYSSCKTNSAKNSQSVPSKPSPRKPNYPKTNHNSSSGSVPNVPKKSLSFASKPKSTPLAKNTSTASPHQSTSKHSRQSAVKQIPSSGNPTCSTSSVPTGTQPLLDSILSQSLPTSPGVTHRDNHPSSTCSQDVTSKYSVDLLLCEQSILLGKIRELTLQLEHQSATLSIATSSPPATSAATHANVAIFSDSMCRGIAMIMSSQTTTTHVTSDIKPGAVFSQVTGPIASQCCDFGPQDYVFVHAGTNDMNDLPPNSAKYLKIPESLINLSHKTNIILCSVPYRYDSKAHLSTNIFETNNCLKYACAKFNFSYFDTNSFMSRSLFTKEGLHYSKRGKVLLASEFIHIVSPNRKFPTLSSNTCPVCTSTLSVPYYSTGSRSLQTMVTSPKPRRAHVSHVRDVGTQVRGYDIDENFDSTFGSGPGSVLNTTFNNDIIDLREINDDLLCSNNSFPIPVLGINSHSQPRQNSNFHFEDRSLGT